MIVLSNQTGADEMQTIHEQLKINRLKANIKAWENGIQNHKNGMFFGGDMKKNLNEIPKVEKRIRAAKRQLILMGVEV
jgi:hypothetical protein